MRTRRHALTLIELLIVIAIIAVVTASLMSFIVAPMREHTTAGVQFEMESGAALASASLVSDIHDARSVVFDPVQRTLTVERAWPGGARVVFGVDARNVLLRTVSVPGAEDSTGHLLDCVESFDVETSAGMATVRFQARRQSYDQPLVIDREVRAIIGNAWAKGATP